MRLSPDDEPPERVPEHEQYPGSEGPLTGQLWRAFATLHLIGLAPQEGEAENNCDGDKADHDPFHVACIDVRACGREPPRPTFRAAVD